MPLSSRSSTSVLYCTFVWSSGFGVVVVLVVVGMVVVVLGVVGFGVVIGIRFGFVVVVATKIGILELYPCDPFFVVVVATKIGILELYPCDPFALPSLEALGPFCVHTSLFPPVIPGCGITADWTNQGGRGLLVVAEDLGLQV